MSSSKFSLNPDSTFGAAVDMQTAAKLGLNLHNYYHVEHWRRGELLWETTVPNLITDEGANDLLSVYLKAGANTPTWYAGLINNAPAPTIVVGDTAAQIGGTNGWTEFTGYTGNRITLAWGAVAARSVATSAAVFPITAAGPSAIYGAFVVSTNTKAGTLGKIYGEATFTAGVRSGILVGDTLNVTVTSTA